MNKGIIAGLIVVALLAVGAFVFLASDDTPESSDPSDQSTAELNAAAPQQPQPQTDDVTVFTLEEVAANSSESSCWTIINGSVYDITSYLSRHPGGNVILEACGTDGTTLFTQRETQEGETVGSGTPHSSNANAQLEQLKIGEIATN